jgi:hypothetical protein
MISDLSTVPAGSRRHHGDWRKKREIRGDAGVVRPLPVPLAGNASPCSLRGTTAAAGRQGNDPETGGPQ